MRNTLNLCRGMLLSVALMMLPGAVVAAGFSDKLAEKVTKDPQAQEQIKNAADALEATVESAITKGEVTRGASGPMMQLVYSSDTLVCSAWIISFRLEVDRLTGIAAHRDMTAEEHRIQRAARELLSRVERACQNVLQPGMASSVTTPTTGGGTSPAATDTPTQGRPFTPRPGWTITDEICARQCERESAAAQRADWNRYPAEENERQARSRLNSAERELAAERENLARAEARQTAARSNLDRLESFNRRAGGVTKGSPSDMNLSNARRNVRDGESEVGLARRRVESREQAASEARGSAERATAARQRAEQEAASAQAALDSCLRNCYKRAAGASGASSGTSTSTGTGSSTGTSTGTSTGGTTSTGTSTGSSTGTSTGGSGSHLPVGGGY